MGYTKKGDLKGQVYVRLQECFKRGFGRSKYVDKMKDAMGDKIYSDTTYQEYKKECLNFVEYVREKTGTTIMPLNDTKELAKEYIKEINSDPNISAWTVKKRRSALAKLYGCKGEELGETAPRKRSDIRRSRERYVISEKTGKMILNPKSRAGHFSEKNHFGVVTTVRCVGFRHFCELRRAKGTDLFMDNDGLWKMKISRGKGGKYRISELCGSDEEIQLVVKLFQQAGEKQVFNEKDFRQMDVHYYRGIYAKRIYKKYARPIETLDKKEIYKCQKDMKGVVYDKEAMRITSRNLGHNRIDVIAKDYLYDLDLE